jgi:cation diffusion facilitator CzcD-associated flavoprotein CzcO
MSRCLAERSIDHVVLERGEVANSWRSERWDSLRLLTPNWQSRLPGFSYNGDDPDGYRTLPEVIDFIASYAKAISAPVRTHTTVTSVRSTEAGYLVRTDRGDWRCRAVVLASGACNIARVPAFADRVPRSIAGFSAQEYRNPGRLADGGVLVVGASSSGTQIAYEIQRSGRPVILSVGEHIRAPRLYRGKDLQWWMDAAGVLDERYDEVDDVARARRVPSLQLAGTPDRLRAIRSQYAQTNNPTPITTNTMPSASRPVVRCPNANREIACANRTSTNASVRTLAAVASAKARNQNCEAKAPRKPASIEGRHAWTIARTMPGSRSQRYIESRTT